MQGEAPRLELAGVLEGGGAFWIQETRFRPYAFVRERDRAAAARELALCIESSELRDLQGAPVARVSAATPRQLADAGESLRARGVELLEADVRVAQRYLIDRGIRSALAIRGEPQLHAPGLWRFRDPELAPAQFRPSLSVLAIDLETTPRADAIYSISLVGAGADEVHVVSLDAVPSSQSWPDEASLLRAVLARIRAIDPDVITGWNVIDFDLRVLEQRARAHRIRLELGRVPGPVRIEREAQPRIFARADIPGRQVLDAMRLVRDAQIPLDDLRLETAARTLLGRGKTIAPGPDAAAEIQRLYRSDRAALVAYNREDSRLVAELLAQEGLIDLAVERSLCTGMPLDRVHASVASFDCVYLPRLRARGHVAPSVPRGRTAAAVAGGAVLDSTPGLFANVVVLDFRSLYPSLMRTFQLDPLSHVRAQQGDAADAIVAPNGARFTRETSVLCEVLDEIHERRGTARAAGQRHADRALKILMNSLFGVLGTPACRFFEPAVANAITRFGQQTLAWTCEAIESLGHSVLYGDTDSVFVALGERIGQAEALRADVEGQIHERIRARYRVEPRLELKLERVYARFFQPCVRGGGQGSKKRYAGLVGDHVEVVGLEAVRRDWPLLARRFQIGLLERVFSDRPVLPFVREVVADVRGAERAEELVYRKGVRKGSLDRYTSRTPQHVEAARRLGGFSGREIRYVVTRAGPEPVRPGSPLPAAIHREHYVERVLRPIADAILPFVGHDFDEALGRPRQLAFSFP
jgi:DNA polymerase II